MKSIIRILPKISVVMPTYNSAQTIPNAIMSILNQTFADFEFIIVDDGSTDNTEHIVKRFQDPRIRYFKRPHLGLVAARNFGNYESESKFIVVQDADDISLPDRLERLYKYRKFDVVVHGIYVNKWDKNYECMTREYRRPQKVDKKRIIKEQYLNGVVMFKRSLWLKKPYRMETQYAYDWSYHIDWILSGAKYKIIDIGLYDYIRYENSASIRFEKEGKREESFKKIKEILKNEYNT